jgi:hypothetical protein
MTEATAKRPDAAATVAWAARQAGVDQIRAARRG